MEETPDRRPQVGDSVWCYRLNAWRDGRIERVGPVWVTASYGTRIGRVHRTKIRREALRAMPGGWQEWVTR